MGAKRIHLATLTCNYIVHKLYKVNNKSRYPYTCTSASGHWWQYVWDKKILEWPNMPTIRRLELDVYLNVINMSHVVDVSWPIGRCVCRRRIWSLWRLWRQMGYLFLASCITLPLPSRITVEFCRPKPTKVNYLVKFDVIDWY